MIEQKVDICVGTDIHRNIRVRLSLMFVRDSKVISNNFHPLNIRPGDDPEAARRDVEEHLAKPESVSGIPGAPWPKIPDSEWNEVLAIVNTLHTPERIAKRREIDRNNVKALTTKE